MWEYDRFPVWLTIAALAFVVVVAVVRVALVHSTAVQRLINRIVLFATVSMLLREPAIATRVDDIVPGGLATLFDMWHLLWLIAIALVVKLVSLCSRDAVHSGWSLSLVVGLSCLVGIGLLVLSQPARVTGISIPDAGGWRYGVYFVCCAVLLVAFCLFTFQPVMALRKRSPTQRETMAVMLVFLLMCADTIATTVTAAGAVTSRAGSDNALSDFACLGASGEPMLLWVVLGCAGLVPSVVRAVAQLLRMDDDSRELRRLDPVWRDLTGAVPGVVLTLSRADRRGAPRAELLHRRRVEILDAAAIVGRYAAPLPEGIDRTIEKNLPDEDDQEAFRCVVELAAASWRLRAIGGVRMAGEPMLGHYSVPELELLARYWKPARSLFASTDVNGLARMGGR
ncbi:DUF6545 domain-containing protein [Nocardia abscessus]|uniref:DUF6545 domain-containing protein n=1 Tax=Nocardia abscessus TaxID=120957 RepID=UPI00245578B8|nr:DUF6545 domain-containing protein [Nocardia abscessus]